MKRLTRKVAARPLVALLLAIPLILTGCAPNRPTQFYTLSATAPAANETLQLTEKPLVVGVGPVALPPYLDRPQLVTRIGANKMMLADFDQWAEPLDGALPRTLSENLSRQLATEEVFVLPTTRNVRLDYRVEVDVAQFDTNGAGDVVVDARWWVFRRGDKLVQSGRSTIEESAGQSTDRQGVVAALSQGLGQLSNDIAAAILLHARG